MISIIAGKKSPTFIDGIEIDATLSEGHDYSNSITSYPIEKGSDITDHVKQTPEEYTIEAITSNTPIKFISESIKGVISGIDLNKRKQDTFTTLLGYAGYSLPKQKGVELNKVSDPVLLTIVTGLRVYNDMIISSISFPIGINTGDALNYTIKFKKVTFLTVGITYTTKVNTANGKAPNIKNQAQKTEKTGKQEPKKTTSILQKGLDYILGK